jgi:hypothetical protein
MKRLLPLTFLCVPRGRSSAAAWALVSGSLVACATSGPGDTSSYGAPEEDAAPPASDSGVYGEDGSAIGSKGPTGPKGNPVVYDSGPPATIGGVVDSGANGSDASGDAAVDGPVDAPVSCGSPGGSYAQTCSSCSVTGSTLSCECQNDSQVLGPTSLDLCSCSQPPVIANANGVLTCP